MHILFLTDNFPPEVNAPASRTFEHCREWVKSGHKVTVLTGAPNAPRGKLYAGYENRLWQSEMRDGIRIVRVWTYITANEGFLRRTLDYISFMISAVLAAPFIRKPDLVVGTSPQFFTACAAYLVSRYKFIPFVFEVRDLWPESIKAVGAMKEGRLLRALEALELYLYHRANRIITVTNAFRTNLQDRGVDGEKITVITNGVDLSQFSARPKDAELLKKYDLQNKFVAGYIGTHGMAHALETVLEAALLVKKRPDGDRFHFLLLGDGACKSGLEAKAREMQLDNLTFIDSVAKKDVARYWSLLDTSIIHLRKDPLFETVIPSKLFECMAMGIPVLHGVAGESADIVKNEDVGLVFESENASALCDQLERLSGNPDLFESKRANCFRGAKKYNRKELADEMLKILEAIGLPDTIAPTTTGQRQAGS